MLQAQVSFTGKEFLSTQGSFFHSSTNTYILVLHEPHSPYVTQ